MLFRRRTPTPSPATLLEEGERANGVYYYRREEKFNPWKLARFLVFAAIVSITTIAVFRLQRRDARLRAAFEKVNDYALCFFFLLKSTLRQGHALLGDGTCVSSKELRDTVSPEHFVLLRLGSDRKVRAL